MKLPSRKSPKKFLIIGAIILVVAGAAGAYLWSQRPGTQDMQQTANTTAETQPDNINYGPATEEEKQEGEAIKEETIRREANQTPPNPDTPPTITISRAGQVGTAISIRTYVNRTTNGTCTATLTQAGQAALTKTFPITMGATSALCNGDIPVSEFSTGGQWQLSIVAKNTNGTASAAATQTLSVTK